MPLGFPRGELPGVGVALRAHVWGRALSAWEITSWPFNGFKTEQFPPISASGFLLQMGSCVERAAGGGGRARTGAGGGLRVR